MLKRTRFIDALLKKPVDRTPIWMMRQAGRYLPEYRALRASTPNFMTFCQTPELACEATLQPLKRFPAIDAAILFSDILTVPAAMGGDLSFVGGVGPKFANPVRDRQAVDALRVDVIEQLGYVMQAIRTIITALDGSHPLIGFAGSPWTVATYLVEGGASKLFHVIKKMLYTEPALLHQLLQKITDVTVAYLNAQVAAGVHALQVFDTWGGVLSTPAFEAFSLQYLAQIASRVTRYRDGARIPLIFFTKGGGQWLEKIAATGCDALGLDWTVPLGSAIARVGGSVALQGNLDPTVLLSTPDAVAREAQHILREAPKTGYVFNLGHGIDQHTPIENVHALMQGFSC